MLRPWSTAARLPHKVTGAPEVPDAVATKSSWYTPGARAIVWPGRAAASAWRSPAAVVTVVAPAPPQRSAVVLGAGGDPEAGGRAGRRVAARTGPGEPALLCRAAGGDAQPTAATEASVTARDAIILDPGFISQISVLGSGTVLSNRSS